MKIPKELLEDITEYCKNNNIDDIDKHIIKLLIQGNVIEKFGSTPFNIEPEIINKEVVIEKTKKQSTKKGVTKNKVEIPKEININKDKTDIYGE